MAGGRAPRRIWRVPRVHDHAAHGAASLGRLLLALLLVFSTSQYPSCYCNGGHGGSAPGGETAGGGKCMERERDALIAVRDDVWGASDPNLQRLPSWKRDDDCCRWKGVACDHWSGHVVKLDLRRYPEYWSGHVVKVELRDHHTYLEAPRSSKVNPSLLTLGSLSYLDLSGNHFSGSPLPSFIGSLVNLEYLNISNTYFDGSVPLELGNLQNLKSLDLSNGFSSSTTTVENLRWLSHLSHLQYLDMSWLNLSAAHDWLQVISMLPSLSVLLLQRCDLPSPPPSTIQIPLGNFTSLSTLDLGSSGLAYSTWPLWLSNISCLTTLVLSNCLNCTVPPEAFKNMKHLEVLSMDGFRRLIPRFLWRMDKLKTLHLVGEDLRIGSSEEMGHLSSLRELTLSGVVGQLPDSLGNIMGLKSLSIIEYIPDIDTHADVTKYIELPKSISNLSRLEHLEVSTYAMGIWLPEFIGKLVGLKTLRVHRVNTNGEVLQNMGDLCNLTMLSITWNKADGAEVTKLLEGLCECIGGSALEQLEIRGNGFRGHLPDQIGKLKNLRYVDLSFNSIDGSIPASIGELESLTHLDLRENQLSGSIPESIGELESLTHLDLSHNQLSGLVPSSIGKLSNLTSLDISYNRLEGDLSEAHFSHLSQLDEVQLSNNAALSLNTSPTWIPPFQLSYFDMSDCNVGPEFPKWLQTQKTLGILDLSSNNISYSTVEDDLFNKLSSKLTYFNLSHNDIKGIPSSICQLKSLVFLDLSYNHFSGQIPDCWRGGDMLAMDFSSNSLVGHIPSSIGMLSNLQLLHLNKNALTGSIPLSLKKCTMLTTLDLSENKLSGEIPSWLGESLSSLRILSLRSNVFHGYLPMPLSGLQSLKILDLGCNKLSGSIRLSFHNLTAMVKIENSSRATISYYLTGKNYFVSMESKSLVTKGTELQYRQNLPLVTMIDLSSNNFSGQFPKKITNLHGLRFLNLSNNHLRGRIPENISTMGLLESLDLSFNQLSGSVPSTMSTMHFLSFLNLSCNSLFGRIPKGQIENFDQYSFIGNLGLCGTPILGPCPGDATSFQGPFQTGAEGFDANHDEHESHMAWFYVSLGPGFVTGFLGFLGVFSLMRRSWRIAYFRFFDSLGDTLYVFVVVRYARLKAKLSA